MAALAPTETGQIILPPDQPGNFPAPTPSTFSSQLHTLIALGSTTLTVPLTLETNGSIEALNGESHTQQVLASYPETRGVPCACGCGCHYGCSCGCGCAICSTPTTSKSYSSQLINVDRAGSWPQRQDFPRAYDTKPCGCEKNNTLMQRANTIHERRDDCYCYCCKSRSRVTIPAPELISSFKIKTTRLNSQPHTQFVNGVRKTYPWTAVATSNLVKSSSGKLDAPLNNITTDPKNYYLKYNGGPIIHTPQIINIFWGEDYWSGNPINPSTQGIIEFTNYFVSSSVMDLLKEYEVGGPINHGSVLLSTIVIEFNGSRNPPAQVDDSDIQDFIAQLIDTVPNFPQITADTIYCVYLPPTTQVTDNSGDKSCYSIAGYHGVFHHTILRHPVFYCVIPDCAPDFRTVAHEIAETITDPNPSSDPFGSYFGWYSSWLESSNLTEIGDLANPNVFTLGDDVVTQDGFTFQKMWSNRAAKGLSAPWPILSMPVSASDTPALTSYLDILFVVAWRASKNGQIHYAWTDDPPFYPNGQAHFLPLVALPFLSSLSRPSITIGREGLCIAIRNYSDNITFASAQNLNNFENPKLVDIPVDDGTYSGTYNGVALVSFLDHLHIVYAGGGRKSKLCIISSHDGGNTWSSPTIIIDPVTKEPVVTYWDPQCSVSSDGSTLYILYTDYDYHQLNIIETKDGVTFSDHVVLTDVSDYAPGLAEIQTSFGNKLMLAWINPQSPNIFSMVSSKGTQNMITDRQSVQMYSDQSIAGIALMAFAGKPYVSWVDSHNNLLFMELGSYLIDQPI